MKKYALGIDFGTLSVRTLLADIRTGQEIGRSVCDYSHGVMSEELYPGIPLPPMWALQDPRDYLESLKTAIQDLMRRTDADPAELIGIGVEFTSSTILPVKADGTPLCFLKKFKDEPHAFVKLWKHHSAEPEAAQIEDVLRSRNGTLLELYGGKVSAEWMLPKVLETLHHAPQVYEAADRFIEALDWVTWQLTGVETRSACGAGYKMFFRHNSGYPDQAFFEALDPRMKNFAAEKLGPPVKQPGEKAGELSEAAADELGLLPGTPVAVGMIDAHASFLGTGISETGIMMIILGTSSCHMLLSEKEQGIPGVGGLVYGGIIPGYFAYEAGQSCVGDHFDWFVRNCLPAEYKNEAEEKSIGIFDLLNEKLKNSRAGQSGLLALDWFNGVRTPLNDYDLSGLILGLTLQTKSEEIYRALIEATAFGTRRILEQFETNGIPVRELVLCGSVPAKNRLLTQIYADVCGRKIRVCSESLAGCLGAAMLGTAAADPSLSGYPGIPEILRAMAPHGGEYLAPDPDAVEIYSELYREYRLLSDYFGSGGNDVMKRLSRIRRKSGMTDLES